VFFDLDGTLLDTLEDIADSVNAALLSLGAPAHEVQAYRRLVGSGVGTLAHQALPPDRRDPSDVAECHARLIREYGSRWDAKTRPYPGVPELLDALSGRRLPLAILSNKPDAFTKQMAEKMLGAWRWAAVEGARDGVPVKPNPILALEAAGRVGLPPSSIIYVGDSGTDVDTARAAGMIPAGALWGFRPWELEESGISILLSHPLDLLRHLGSGE
jgi:phosphoglycolate phosphatase